MLMSSLNKDMLARFFGENLGHFQSSSGQNRSRKKTGIFPGKNEQKSSLYKDKSASVRVAEVTQKIRYL
jgi:hypothetical protein